MIKSLIWEKKLAEVSKLKAEYLENLCKAIKSGHVIQLKNCEIKKKAFFSTTLYGRERVKFNNKISRC
jgi:hypothetical protein